jgi:hypothetical protein
MESLFQENGQVGRDGVPLPGERSGGQRWSPSSRGMFRWAEMKSPSKGMIGWAKMESLIQGNVQVGRHGVPLLGERSVGQRLNPSSRRLIRWEEMESF